MKNFIQSGDTVPLPAPYAVNGGDGLQVGALFGVATSAAAACATVETTTAGSATARMATYLAHSGASSAACAPQ